MNARRQLAALLSVGLALRLLWWHQHVAAIESEGVEYTRIAQTWFDGLGYRGILDGIEVMFPPGYPLLIGIVELLVGEFERAARVVSLLAGLVLIALCFAITRRVAGARAGLLGGVLAATNPLLVALSVTTYVEGLAGMCVLLATWCALRSPGSRRPLVWALGAGAAVGYAYLARPELVVLSVPIAGYLGWAAWARQRRAGAILAAALACALGCAVVAAPQVVRLTQLSGSLRWEGKTGANELINDRMARGMGYAEAARGLDVTRDFERSAPYLGGPDLSSEQLAFLVSSKQHKSRGGADLLKDVVRRVPDVASFWLWAVRQWTSIWKLPVGVLALLAGFWSLRRASRRRPALLLLGAVFGLHALFPLGVRFLWSRYGFPILPVSIPWLAIGAVLLFDGAHARIAAVRRNVDARWLLPGAAVVALLIALSSYAKVSMLDDFEQSHHAEVPRAGREIARRFASDERAPGAPDRARPLVMGYSAPLAHYAGAALSYLPQTKDVETALRYVHWKQPDFIALHEPETNEIPYVKAWFEQGLPDACAEPVYRDKGVAGDVRIWRWRCGKQQ